MKAHCPSCDNDAEMILYGNGRAACSVCGSDGRWVDRPPRAYLTVFRGTRLSAMAAW